MSTPTHPGPTHPGPTHPPRGIARFLRDIATVAGALVGRGERPPPRPVTPRPAPQYPATNPAKPWRSR